MEAMAFIRNSEGWNSYFWRKWIPTGNLDGYWGEYNRTPYEFPLIRLGDVILMLAEAYNENGDTDKAVAMTLNGHETWQVTVELPDSLDVINYCYFVLMTTAP